MTVTENRTDCHQWPVATGANDLFNFFLPSCARKISTDNNGVLLIDAYTMWRLSHPHVSIASCCNNYSAFCVLCFGNIMIISLFEIY